MNVKVWGQIFPVSLGCDCDNNTPSDLNNEIYKLVDTLYFKHYNFVTFV